MRRKYARCSDETTNMLTITITFLCSDPYKYGTEQEIMFDSDIVTITNEGTSETYPTFEMTITKPVTFAMIQNQLETHCCSENPLTMMCRLSKKQAFYSNGSTLSQWTATTIVCLTTIAISIV